MSPHRNVFSQHPLAQLAVAFAAGVCAAHAASLKLSVTLGALCMALVVSFLITKRLRLAGLGLLLAMFFAGVILADFQRHTDDAIDIKRIVDEPTELTGVLDRPPEFARDRLYLSLQVERISGAFANGRVSILATFRNAAAEQEFRSLQLRYGTRVSIRTSLDRTGNYRNPGVSSLAEYLDRNDYDASGIIKSATSITRLDDTHVFPALVLLYEWRESLQRQIDTRFAPETAGVLDAALLGNRYNLSQSASERFREGGTFHVLVISGLHISFIGGLVLLIISRITKRRLVQFVLPAVIVWSYSIAVGAESSVIRAAFMFTFAGLAPIVFRRASSLNALGAAALVLLVRSPKELFDPGFQLTFLSVLAIIVLAWPLLLNLAAIGSWFPTRATPYPPVCSRELKWFCELLFWSEREWRQQLARSSHDCRLFKARPAAWIERYQIQRCLRYLFGAVLVSASVQLVLLPLMIVYFHRLSLASLVLNIVVGVLLAVLMAVALAGLLIAKVSLAISSPLFKLADAITWLMVHSVDPFSALNFRLPEYTGSAAWLYALYYLPLLLLVVALSHWRPLALSKQRRCRLHRFVLPAAALQMLLTVLLILHPLSSGRAGAALHIDFLDVGQGDAALITMPDGTTLLVDGGGNIMDSARRIGETVVSEYLWWRGLDHVDYVLVTHADADHIDGLNDVLKNFAVRGALIARAPANDPEFAKFSETLKQTNTHAVKLQAGDVIHFGEVELSVLWPPAGSETSANNDSIVLRVKFGQRSILLTGDIEKQAEKSLLDSGQSLRADIVKIPHHGSKSSSTEEFVRTVAPEFAIISVGRHSMFGHPHKEVVQRWQANGATVLTTGECGTITITTDGKDLRLNKFLQPQ
ncbi:MAG TPA: DNA internalization-related competence protein ComEC/Rec2 [Pyrinomonadaceae bacterium]|nr:DNA internalization-related competence protein ComEC/Rec2 [Pyrinomonadaceae bacterium]